MHAKRTIRVGKEMAISWKFFYTFPSPSLFGGPPEDIDGISRPSECQETIEHSWKLIGLAPYAANDISTRESDKSLQLMSDLGKQLGDWSQD